MKTDSTPIGLYIHIPFCKSRCSYCNFCSVANADTEMMDDYTQALLTQLEEFFPGKADRKCDSVYFGGGTPSYFGEDRLIKLLFSVGKKLILDRNAEITVEVNPESAAPDFFAKVKRSGVNRISMGVQSMYNNELKRLGRAHRAQDVARAVQTCRDSCTGNISLDLMYGIPEQTMDTWRESLKQVVELNPRHISCYGLKLEEGTPLHAENPDLPDEETQANMYMFAVDYLEKMGYAQYEISNFAMKGYESRHNKKYWQLKPYIGLGASAHGFYMDKRFFYTDNVQEYLSSVKNGGRLVEYAEDSGGFSRHGEYTLLSLRTSDGFDRGEFEKLFPRINVDGAAKRLEGYIQSGHVLKSGDVYRLTPRGFLVSNYIIGQVLEAYETW